MRITSFVTLSFVLQIVVLGQRTPIKPFRQSTPVAPILRPAFEKIRTNAKAPIFLPDKLPSSINAGAIHVVEGEITTDGWQISLRYSNCCGNASFAGFFDAERAQTISVNESDEIVTLAQGIKGYYTARSCGGSCTPPQIRWERQGTVYMIQFRVKGTAAQARAAIIAIANSAILAGAR